MSPIRKAWSISALEQFELCPKQYYTLKVAKSVVEPESEQMRWGKTVHSAFENYIKKQSPFPPELASFEAVAKAVVTPIKAHPQFEKADAELKIALTAELKATSYFAKDVWVRSVIDMAATIGNSAYVLDWKTGKRKDGSDQLALSAAALMAVQPAVQEVYASYVWLQEPPKQRVALQTYRREQLPDIWAGFLNRTAALDEAFAKSDFPPRPNYLCRRYCPVTSCPHHGG